MVRHRLVMLAYTLVALPPLVVTLSVGAVVCGELRGSHPMTVGAPRSVAEAIALRDTATAARMIEDGASASDINVIRPGLLADRPVLATPLEVAVILDQGATVDFLASKGAPQTDSLACLAVDVGARHVRPRRTDRADCRPGEALRAVLARP